MAIVTMTGTAHEKCGSVEYTMSEQMAKEILHAYKMKDGPMTKRGQECLCREVNSTFGLKDNCVRVLIK